MNTRRDRAIKAYKRRTHVAFLTLPDGKQIGFVYSTPSLFSRILRYVNYKLYSIKCLLSTLSTFNLRQETNKPPFTVVPYDKTSNQLKSKGN